ncbi:MAG: GNAT family N-acetyltransferase, partial [Alphaproteobacteria bacterium]|nr:GNAT family N-acetyltransferase [Alphaproteobacteria bacterium]
KSIAATAINQLWDMYPGKWQLEVIPKNTRALHFWRRVIHAYSHGNFDEILDFVDYASDPKVIFRFNTQNKNPEPVIHIRHAMALDIPAMVALSHEKRRAYEKVQPTFWRHAKGAEEAQTMWFNELLMQDDYILLVAESEKMIAGFIIGRLMNAPEVYDPGGLTIMIDDFCVRDPSQWVTIGRELLARIKEIAKDKCAVQIVIVCGAHDEHKRHFLKQDDLTIASEWYVGGSAS